MFWLMVERILKFHGLSSRNQMRQYDVLAVNNHDNMEHLKDCLRLSDQTSSKNLQPPISYRQFFSYSAEINVTKLQGRV